MDVLAVACAIVAAALYYNTLHAGFVYDDRRAILTNDDLKPSTPWIRLLENDFWGTPLKERGSHGSYRPLCVATYRLNYSLTGLEPFSYHLVNVILHALCTALVVRIARKVLPGQRLAQVIAGLLFAVHPIHCEAVAGIVGRADLLACLFAQGAFLCYVGHYEQTKPFLRLVHLVAAILLSVLATLAKETGISSLALCLLWDFCHSENILKKVKVRRNGCWSSTSLVAGSLAILTLGRLRVAGGRAPEFATADNPVARHPSRLARGLSFLYLPAASLGMLLCPCSLSFDWSMNAVPMITGFRDWRNIQSILLYSTLTTVIVWAVRHLKSAATPPAVSSPRRSRPRRNPNWEHHHQVSYHQQQSQQWSSCPSSGSTTGYSTPATPSTIMATSGAALLSSSWLSSVRCPVCAGRRTGSCHTDGCRAANNNNGPVAECHCPKKKPPQQQQQQHHPRREASTHHKPVQNRPIAPKPQSTTTTALLLPSSVLTIIGFLVLPFLPASNLFFYVGFVIAERILYLPSVGACLAVGASISGTYNIARRKGFARTSKAVLFFTALLITCMSAKTFIRNIDWYNEENLYRSALKINPPKAYGNLGSVLSAQGRIKEAEEAFIEALRHRPNMADVHYNLGIIQQGRRNYEEAILSYQRAIHFRPSLAQAYLNLGATLVSVGRSKEAISVLRAGASLDGSALKDKKAHESARVQALLQLGSIYAEQGRLHKALSSYREALRMLPEHYPPQSVYNLLGETFTRLQQYTEAEKWFQASLASQPDHVPAHITYGKLLARNSSRVSEAERWFLRARRLAPQDSSVHHHYGLFLSTQGRLSEAASSHLEAASLARSDYELAVAAASALRRASRCEEAEIWYRHALGLRPQEARSHANLGAILHLNGKYKQAAQAYREALRLQPGDATTITNLHKLAQLLA